MTSKPGPTFKFNIEELSSFSYENVKLSLTSTYLYSDLKDLCFEYNVIVDRDEVGVLTALINEDQNLYRVEGNIGLTIERAAMNKAIPYKVVKAIFPLYKHFKQDKVTITTNKEDGSVSRMCLDLNGKFLDVVNSDNDEKHFRYIIPCK